MNLDFPVELLITINFEEQAGRTRLTLRHAVIPKGKERDLITGRVDRFAR
jgi:hypothetical protein